MNQVITTATRCIYAGLNSAYQPLQSYEDSYKHGSRRHFGTDNSINGEYFRSRSKNEYFQIIEKKMSVGDLSIGIIRNRFIPLRGEMENRLDLWGYDPKKHSIVLLEFSKNKGYFVESNQDVQTDHPDVTIMSDDTDIYDLLMSRPKFVPLPDSYSAHKEGL
jgi:hypothetical protein